MKSVALILLFGVAACRLPSVDDEAPAFGERVKVTTTTHGSARRPDVAIDAGTVLVAMALRPVVPSAPVVVAVVPPERRDHPLVAAVKAVFTHDEAAHDRGVKAVMSPALHARYRVINERCREILAWQDRNNRLHRLSSLCDWDRTRCGNGGLGARTIIVEQIATDTQTARVTVINEADERIPVELAVIDGQWRITLVDCGRDEAVEASGILEAERAAAPVP